METTFIEEIDFQELKFLEVVGKGAFGVVSRAKWRGKDVAVKRIETESERLAFMQELKQLSRVNHPNIVRLYGACREHPVCLVMEYAEGGSLYNVLHGSGQQPNYTAAHAMSWCLQCARGVEYLHNMKPKALVHRDLKPPNLLLILGGTVLKICDFGTACDIQTHMTNNKGSAAWMAPEVFEGSNYSEKCDVFSWGIILWEVLTRRKPFNEINGPAFAIMWAVHNGRRPPPIQNLPKPLEVLMTRCWSGNPSERPSMAEVSRVMGTMYQFFKGGDDPLVISRASESWDEDDYSMESAAGPFAVATGGMTGESHTRTISGTLRYHDPRPAPVPPPVVVEEESKKPRGQMSAPPSLAASRESLNDPRSSRSATPVDTGKRFSADLSRTDELDHLAAAQPSPHQIHRGRGHRRSGSQGTTPAYVHAAAAAGPSYPPQSHGPRTSRSGSVDGLLNHARDTPSPSTPTPQIIVSPPTSPSRLALPGHRRIGSDEYARISLSPLSINTGEVGVGFGPSSSAAAGSAVHHSVTYPSHLAHLGQGGGLGSPVRGSGDGQATSPPSRSVSYQPPGRDPIPVSPRSFSLSSETPLSQVAGQGHEAAFANVEHVFNNEAYFSLEPHLQPIPPCPSNRESMQIFEDHCRLAQEYLRMQAEIAVLTQRKHELNKEREKQEERSLKSGSLADLEEYQKLSAENESLMKVHRDLKSQVEKYRKQTGQRTTRG